MRFGFALLTLAFILLMAPAIAPAQLEGSSSEIESALQTGANLPPGLDLPNLNTFYRLRHYAPAWQLGGPSATNAARDFSQYIRSVLFEHGLNDARYPLRAFEQKMGEGTPLSMMQADILATHIVLKIARSLSGQDPIPTDDPDHIWPMKRAHLDVAQGLEAAVEARQVPNYLEGLAPHNTQYIRLKQSLAEYRGIAGKGGWIKLIPGYRLNMGEQSPVVPLLAQRLWQENYLPQVAVQYANTLYSPQIAEAVKSFQAAHGLITDGNIGAQTLLAMNIGVQERIDEIRANMARMRVTPLEAWNGIIINIPSFRLFLFRNDQQLYSAPVVVGRPDRASPLVNSTISEIIINPAWYVPQSIAERDILPKLRDNPELLEEMNMSGPRDAETASDGSFMQKPGPDNSLGRIKFNFPNRFSVYLHGTPHVELFDRDDRRQSSGCIRLKKPEELAEILMGNTPEWSEARIQERIDSMKTMHVTPQYKAPIHLLYWTVMVNSQNHVEFYNDVYQLDDAWLALL